MNRLNEILERQAAIQEELRELEEAESEASEDNPLPDDHAERVDGLVAEFDTLEEERAPLAEREEKRSRIRQAAIDQPARTVPGTDHAPREKRSPYDISDLRHQRGEVTELRGRAMDAIESDRFLEDDQKQHATRLVENIDRNGELARHVLATGNPNYRTGFVKALHGYTEQLDEDERQAVADVRAQSLTGNAGGFAVPFTLDPTMIITGSGSISNLREISRVETITTDEWNGITGAQVTASYDAEAAEVSDDSVTLSQPSIDVEMARAFAPASIEITQDWARIATELGRVFEDAKMNLENDKFVTGGGAASTEPGGVVYQVGAVAGSRVASTTISAYGLVDVYNTLEGLPPRHRSRASWLANLAIINDTRQFGTANNYHAFLTDLSGDSPGQLLGKPWYESSAMDSVVTTNADALLVGDFSKFLIVDRVGMTVEFIPHLFATNANRPSGQRGYFAYWRNGSGVIDTDAFRVLRLSG